jgi:hypothetical protein
VWEEQTNCRNPGGGTNGGGTTTSSKEATPTTEDLAAAAGLSPAEYAAFLASGLTLEQFLASRLAATGSNSQAIVWGVVGSLLLVALGSVLQVKGRRERVRLHA